MYDVGGSVLTSTLTLYQLQVDSPPTHTHPRTAILFIPVGTPLVFLHKATVDRKIKHLAFVFFKQLVNCIISNKITHFLNFA